jgi:hypothetical protein
MPTKVNLEEERYGLHGGEKLENETLRVTKRCEGLQIPVRQLLAQDSDDDFELRSSPACPPALHKVLDDSLDWEWLEVFL